MFALRSKLLILWWLAAATSIGKCNTASNDTTEVEFGECIRDKNGCRECYFSLLKALLGNDENVFNLSQVFTPPTFDQPTYVRVNYRFFNECSLDNGNNGCVSVDEIHTWLWAKSGAYFLYPLVTFQYISLLFGNAEHLYEREVFVTLDATECYGASTDHIALLTQRLKIHILEQDFYPKMDETYKAVAVNDSSVRDVFFDTFYGGESLSSADIMFACPIMVIAAMLLITGIIIFLHIWRWRSNKKHNGLKWPVKVNILSFSIISFIRLFIFVIFDGLAFAYKLPCSDASVSAVCTFVPLLYNIPLTVLIFDILFLIIAFISVIFSISQKALQCVKVKDSHYYSLTIVPFCFIFSCLVHMPYVTMAYLSDAHYATSILVYYFTILLFELGLIHHTLKIYFDLEKQSNKLKHVVNNMAVFIVVLCLLLVLLYGLVIALSFYYYYLPINNAITDLPNEGIVVYQTGLILAGAYITYRTVFQTDKRLKEMRAMDDVICKIKKAEIAVLKSKSEKIVTDSNRLILLHMQVQLVHVQRSLTYLMEGHMNSTSNDVLLGLLEDQENDLLLKLGECKKHAPGTCTSCTACKEYNYFALKRSDRLGVTVVKKQNDTEKTSIKLEKESERESIPLIVSTTDHEASSIAETNITL